MRVERISIHNFIGIEHLELKPGAVTKLHGPNGCGKSSAITAIQSIIKGGHKIEYRRAGTEEVSEVGLIIATGDDRVEITKRINESGSTPQVRLNGAVQKQPAQIIRQLFDTLSVNPVEFIQAKPDEQYKWLLEAMPFELTAEDFERHGIDTTGWNIPRNQSGFETLEAVRQWLYDLRREENVKARDRKATAQQLKDSLVDGDGSEFRAEMERLQVKAAEVQANINNYQERIEQLLKEAIAEITATAGVAIADIEKQIAALEAQKRSIIKDRDDDIAASKLDASKPQKSVIAWQEELSTLRTEYKVAQEKFAQFERSAGVRQQYEKSAADAKQAEARAKDLDSALKKLDAMKSEILGSLPIKDVEIRGKEIYYRGFPLSTQNEATKVILALKVAALRVEGKVPLICVDGAECLDSATYEAMQEFAEREGLQLIVTRVTDDEELRVE